MLKKLTIKNVALIVSVEIDFENGLNVLSGETGAGKSVIIDSLNFVLGAKADKTMIRTGQEECFVKAEFEVESKSIEDVLRDLDIECDDLLIISRKFNVDGKTSIKVNGSTITASMLKKLTARLVDVHGQSEHFFLLKSSNQLDLIDKFGGQDVEDVKSSVKTLYLMRKEIIKELEGMGGDENQRLTRLDILNYQINEINSANIKENEEEELIQLRDKLKNQEKILLSLNSAKCAINDEGGVLDIISNVNKCLSSISNFGDEYSAIFERLSSTYSEINDVLSEIDSLTEQFEYIEFDPDQVENRLTTIKALKKKYGQTYNDIMQFLANAEDEKDRLENFNELTQKLIEKKTEQEKLLYAEYCKLSEFRRKYAKKFSENVLAELVELNMSKSKFEVSFSDMPQISDCEFDSSNGFDNIEFLFSANLGEPLKPLSSVISGGEMSRFMLAIKAQTAKYNDMETFIFDEIDAGISGVVAKVVAEKFARISKEVQIIAISHLPQISAMADNNLFIEKTENDENTLTNVISLDYEHKIKEITRLIGGDFDSTSAKTHAKELIEQAKSYKQNI